MYPFGTLPDNLVAFGGFLREHHAFRVGPREIHDAARALEIVDLVDERAVRDALRPVLSGTFQDAAVFDEAFTEFFFPGPPGVPQANLPPPRRDIDPNADGVETIIRRPAASDPPPVEERPHADSGPIAPIEVRDGDRTAPALTLRSSYSPLDADASESPALTRADDAWREAARSFVRRLQLGLTRRWRPAAKGRRFDLRRTLRASLQTGGEVLSPRWLRRPRRTPRVVLLIDGSRSMSEYAPTALQLAVAVAASTLRVEVFTFSTALRRVTTDVRRAAAGETRRLERLHHAWAGGTSIGTCVADFLNRFGERMVGRDTVVLIASDGLDVGAVEVLTGAMRDLHRRSAGVVWLNPLRETPGYEPTARGMRAARPYISTFASVDDAASLARLARTVRLHA
jgi:uncharacterized protein with von Willebrand factor type A (vWA) domain